MADFLNSTGLTQVLQAVKRAVPTTLAALSDDATHRLVTDTEKSAWNNKADVFVAIYDSTTQDEVLTAAAAGKMVVCYYNNRLYMYAGTSTAGYCQFTSLLYDTAYRVYLKNSSWGNATMDIPTDVVKYTSQSLLDSQKTQARTNIGAGTYSKPEAGIPENDLSESVQDKLNGPMERGSGQNSAKQIGSGANALGDSSFAENSGKASGLLSHAEGSNTTARGGSSHAEGSDTTASGNSSHAEGQGTIASGNGSHAEGVGYNDIYTTAGADSAHAEGAGVVVKGQAAHGEGLLNVAGRTQEEAVAALADFHNLSGTTEQKVSKLIGFASHSEGSSTRALGTSSHAEGNSTQALVNATHAEGDSTTASGEAAHSEGYNTTASGNQAHAEGYHTEATANQAHAEGKYTEATSENAHAEGNHTTANGNASHTEGYYTVANNNAEHAEGQYNVSNKASTTFGNAGNTIHSVGIGTSNARKNAFEIMQNGDAYLLGIGGYNGKNYSSASTLQSVLSNIPSAVTDSTVSGWGYIKSYTETDPIFSASPAAGITASDITGWNNKVSNVQADWDATTGLGVILNKPTIPPADYVAMIDITSSTDESGNVKQSAAIVSGTFAEIDAALLAQKTVLLIGRDPNSTPVSYRYFRSGEHMPGSYVFFASIGADMIPGAVEVAAWYHGDSAGPERVEMYDGTGIMDAIPMGDGNAVTSIERHNLFPALIANKDKTFVDTAQQTLTDTQKAQARTNIGATALEDIRQFKVLSLGDFNPSNGTHTLGTKSEAATALNITEAQFDSLLNGEYDYIEMSAAVLGGHKVVSVPSFMSEYIYVVRNEHSVAMSFRLRFKNLNTGAYSYEYEQIGIKDVTVGGESVVIANAGAGIAAIPAIPTTYAGSPTAGGFANKAVAIPFGNVDSDSTATNIKATVDNFPAELTPGVCAYIRNDVIASANGWTLNINGTGALPVYQTLADATRTSTIFSAATTHLFVYNPTRVKGGCWDIFYGYNSNDNTIGYNLRTNAMSLPVTSACYRYRLLFTSADKAHFVPANASTSTNATTKRNTTQTPIDPFGSIRYYSATSAVSSGNRPSASYLWEQYSITLGYSFNRTGAALTLTAWKPVYIKCAPQADGSAIIEAETPYVQNLPTTADGKIYIFLGVATAATTVEMVFHHPVYYHDGTKVTNWLGPVIGDIQTALDAIIGRIKFTITDNGVTTEYRADVGMTWGDWLNSSYNTYGFYTRYDSVYTHAGNTIYEIPTDDGVMMEIETHDLIEQGKAYTTD